MTNRICLSAVMLGAAAVAVIIAGCGGGGAAAAFDPTTTGTVTGVVVALGNSEGTIVEVEGVRLQVGGRSGTTDSDGRFTIRGVPEGDDQELGVTPPDGYLLASNATIMVDVDADQVNELPAPILVYAESEGPPQEPEE